MSRVFVSQARNINIVVDLYNINTVKINNKATTIIIIFLFFDNKYLSIFLMLPIRQSLIFGSFFTSEGKIFFAKSLTARMFGR